MKFPGAARLYTSWPRLAISAGHQEVCLTSQVLATDGIWEVMTAQEVVHFVHRWRKRPWQGWNASDALTLEAQERWKKLQPEVCLTFSSCHHSLAFPSILS